MVATAHVSVCCRGEDGEVGQSVAINYYVAAKLGLLGDSVIETAHILSIQEHLKEMKDAYNKVVPYGTAPTEENLDKWYVPLHLPKSHG